jgi:hypothetical protein
MVAASWWFEPAPGGSGNGSAAAASFNLTVTLPPNVRGMAWLPLPPGVVSPALTACAGAAGPVFDGLGYAGYDISYLPACSLGVAWQ